MGTVLFAWELGAGLGHLVRLQPMAERLARRGHRVVFALRDLSRVAAVFGDMKATFLQAPLKLQPPRDQVRLPMTLPHILHNVGFADAGELATLAGAWRGLFEMTRPDVIVFDHSPTALLAARGFPAARRALIGTGFLCPPDVYPMPNLRPALPAAPAETRADEDRVLEKVNRVLAGGSVPPLDRVGRLYSDVDLTLLATFRELDHYPDRAPPARYRGVFNRAAGKPPQWPAGEGQRVYAYLKPFAALPALLRHLNERRCPTIVVGDGIDARWQQEFRSPTLRFEDRQLDITSIGRECDLAITNGNHGTTAAMLLAGRPVLHVPLHLEQAMMSHTVARFGAGLHAPVDQPKAICDRLDDLLQTPSHANAAAALAARYAGFDAPAEYDEMAEDVERLLN